MQLDDLRAETRGLAERDDSLSAEEDDIPGALTHEIQRSPAERHAFLFGHSGRGQDVDLSPFKPLLSQVQFLYQTFVDNVNVLLQLVYMPITDKLVRKMTSPMSDPPSPCEEALMFAIYYAAVTSMEPEDVGSP
jgi:hypothetical protein